MLRPISGTLNPPNDQTSTIDLARLESADTISNKKQFSTFSRPLHMALNISRKQITIFGTLAFLFICVYLLTNNNQNSSQLYPSVRSYQENQKILSEKTLYRLAVVTDLDHDSKDNSGSKPFWKSFYREASLKRDPKTGKYSIMFDSIDNTVALRSRLNLDGRGMELSWLCQFNGKLYTGDDRAGVVYSIENKKAVARMVLGDGDGTEEKGFKSEWAAVKDDMMFIGSFGKEWSNDQGEIVNNNPQWVKIVDKFGSITHVDWRDAYEAMRKESGYSYPGYLFHEAAAWNPSLRKWVFIPRRTSKEKYNPELDETKGGKLIIIADENFKNIKTAQIDTKMSPDGINPKGYSDIKFVPGQPNDIVALRSMEYQGVTKSWITVFNINGKVLMEDVFIDEYKFEGVEFV